MPDTEVRLAKLSRPRVGNILARERLFASIDRLREKPVVWIAAEPGAGKTTLLASYLDARKLSGIWYHVDGGDADPASFFYHLGLAAQGLKRRKGPPSTPLPLLTPDQGTDLAGFSRRYFRELYTRMGAGSALVLDNLHEVPDGTPFHRVLMTAFEEMPEGISSLVASRVEPPSVYTPLITRDRFAFVDAGEIRLTLEETGDIVSNRAELDEKSIRRLHEQSGGWAAGLTLLVERARRGEPIDGSHDHGALQPVFAYFAEQLIAQDFREDTETLLELAFLPRVTLDVARTLTGSSRVAALLDKLYRRHLFTQRRVVGGRITYELHALLRAYLQQRAAETWATTRRHEVVARAAKLLEEDGDLEDAVSLYRELGDWPSLARAIIGAAQALMAQGRRQTLRDWISLLPDEVRQSNPRVLYWLGAALTQDAPREARSVMKKAHAAFTRAGDPLGRILAACGLLYTYYLDLADLRDMDPYVAELNAAVDARVPFPTPAIELHLQAALLFGLCFRHPDTQRIHDCTARMFALLEHPAIGPNEKVASAALLLFSCYHHSDIEAGHRLAALINPMLPKVAPAVEALWWIQVGFLQITSGDTPAGMRAFETSTRISEENSLHIPLIEVYVQMGMGMANVLFGDFARAEACRQRAFQQWNTFRTVDIAANAMLQGVIASYRGDFAAAREFAREHFEVSDKAGIQWQAHNALLHMAFVAYESDRNDEGQVHTRRARAMVKGNVFERFHYQSDLLDAYGCLRAGDREGMRELLKRGLVAGRVDFAKFFIRLQPNLLSRLFAAALEEGIETEVVRRDIENLKIAPPDPYFEGWPWPLAVHTLGAFEVRRAGRPLEFSRKAPRKTLALLKAIIALGGENVREQAILDALWPDEEGDAASKSLGAAVLRLRTLLGDNEAVIQQAGTLSLDRNRIWVDAWAFEHADRLDLYKGSFLADEEGEPWPVPMRERLRSRFIQRVAEHGTKLEQAGRFEAAIEHYLRGLDADSIVEPFYQGLMRCYHHLDRFAEAASSYRRLKQILSVTLGVAPSSTTERLYKSLRLAGSRTESVGEK